MSQYGINLPAPVIVRERGYGKKHKYYTQECQRCHSTLEIPANSLSRIAIMNRSNRIYEYVDHFWCPECNEWIMFSWNTKEFFKTDKDLMLEQQQQQQQQQQQVVVNPTNNIHTEATLRL